MQSEKSQIQKYNADSYTMFYRYGVVGKKKKNLNYEQTRSPNGTEMLREVHSSI